MIKNCNTAQYNGLHGSYSSGTEINERAPLSSSKKWVEPIRVKVHGSAWAVPDVCAVQLSLVLQ